MRGTPAKRGRSDQQAAPADLDDPGSAEHRAGVTWAQRLTRVFRIDIEICSACGGAERIVGYIEDPDVIEKTLCHGCAIMYKAYKSALHLVKLNSPWRHSERLSSTERPGPSATIAWGARLWDGPLRLGNDASWRRIETAQRLFRFAGPMFLVST